MLVSKLVFAHQIDLSTVIFSKTPDGKVVVQVTSSLTAFQGEINYLNPKDSYKSPEEFQKLVIDHFYKTFSMVLNEKVKFINPIVILGHETKIVAEVTGFSKNVNAIKLKSEIFKDINNNQTIVIYALDGFPVGKNFVLNKDNKQEINILLKEGNWEEVEKTASSFSLKYLLFLSIPLLFGLVFFINKKNKVNSMQLGV